MGDVHGLGNDLNIYVTVVTDLIRKCAVEHVSTKTILVFSQPEAFGSAGGRSADF